MGIFDFFNKRRKEENHGNSKERVCYDVRLPEEDLISGEMRIDGQPRVCLFNIGIMTLTPKEAFPWYLSLAMHFENTVSEGMPNREDLAKMIDFSDFLCNELAGEKEHPNAIFMGRVTGGGWSHLMWYVNNPEIANAFLQLLIESGNYPFHFEFEMRQDLQWQQAHYWLDDLISSADSAK